MMCHIVYDKLSTKNILLKKHHMMFHIIYDKLSTKNILKFLSFGVSNVVYCTVY